jgi:hypothetical protein
MRDLPAFAETFGAAYQTEGEAALRQQGWSCQVVGFNYNNVRSLAT